MNEHQLEMEVFNRESAERQILEEQKTVNYETKEYTVELLVDKLRKGDLVIPSYQRDFVWDVAKQSCFIESMIIGLPIPFMFGADIEQSGQIEIVDGSQRLRTLRAFLDGTLKLKALQKLELIEGYRFSDLSLAQQRRFLNRTIRMIVLFEQTDFHTRFAIFERINTTSENVRPAELRKGAFGGKFYALVSELSDDEKFKRLCPLGTARAVRVEGEELVLRFLAYSASYQEFSHDVRYFLDNFLIRRNREAEKEPSIIDSARSQFRQMLDFVERTFPFGFAKSSDSSTTPRVRFEALAVGSHLALTQRPKLKVSSIEWIESSEFKEFTRSDASNSRPKLARRIEYVRDQLLRHDESG